MLWFLARALYECMIHALRVIRDIFIYVFVSLRMGAMSRFPAGSRDWASGTPLLLPRALYDVEALAAITGSCTQYQFVV